MNKMSCMYAAIIHILIHILFRFKQYRILWMGVNNLHISSDTNKMHRPNDAEQRQSWESEREKNERDERKTG